jgi:hypothetical protein
MGWACRSTRLPPGAGTRRRPSAASPRPSPDPVTFRTDSRAAHIQIAAVTPQDRLGTCMRPGLPRFSW